jgi:hypothetical protein
MVLFAHVNTPEAFFGFILVSLLLNVAASFIQLVIVWRRGRALNAQLASIQDTITRRTVVQTAVYQKP